MKISIKSILGATWKVGLGLFGLGTAIIGILAAITWHEKTHGHMYWYDRTLTGNIVVESYFDNTVRVWDKESGSYTTGKLRWVSGAPRNDSLTVFCDTEGRRGYINVKTGKIAIPAQYNKAWQFSEGLGAVMGENDYIGFIDKDNNLVIDYEIPYEKGFDYVFKDGFCVVKYWDSDKYRCAVYGKEGVVLGWNYTRIDEPECGYRVVENEDGCWLYDSNFNKVLPDTYEKLAVIREKNGIYATKNHIKQLLAFDGTVIEPFVIDDTYKLKYVAKYDKYGDAEYEELHDSVVYQMGIWEGLMDSRTGRIITPPDYWTFEAITKDLVLAQLAQPRGSVVMDRHGNVLRKQ